MTEDQQHHAGHWVFLWLMLAVAGWIVVAAVLSYGAGML